MGTSESVRSAHGVDSAGLVLDREVSGVLEGWVGREQVVFFLFLLFTCQENEVFPAGCHRPEAAP